MTEIQEQRRVTNAVMDSAEGVDEATTPVEGTTTNAPEETAGAVGALVGMLTGGFVFAVAAGFVVGVAAGVAVSRLAAPPPTPRWQVWR